MYGFHRLHWFVLLLVPMFASATVAPARITATRNANQELRIMQIENFSPFADVADVCYAYQPPEIVSHRLPVDAASGTAVKVNFVVDAAGRVQSMFLLESSSQNIEPMLHALSGWRYRPATCDGEPIVSQGTVELRIR